jgi:hypothetical protein
MRIPISVVVMSLLTAAPFALAIRDTVNEKKKPTADELEELGLDDYERRSARRDRERLAEYEAEAAREAAERARDHEAKVAQLDTLYGKNKASIGSVFGVGVQIGGIVPDALERRVNELNREGFLLPTVEQTGTALVSLRVDIYSSSYDYNSSGEDACETLRNKLVGAWGPSSSGVWTDPAAHARAILSTDRPCSLTFEKYLEPTDWIAALPLDAIGKKSEVVEEKAIGADVYDDTIEWSIPGTGAGKEPTHITAYVDNGKVVFVSIMSDTDYDTLVAIRDALSAKLKAQPGRDDDTDGWIWKKKPGFLLTQGYSTNRFTLQFGKDPYL